MKKNPDDHNCESKRRKGNVPQATQFWVCEKVKDWLVEDASIGPKELQRTKIHIKLLCHIKGFFMVKSWR